MNKKVTKRLFTTKQMGDACEMLVAGELTLAGIPAHKMPDNWPGYDIVAQPLGVDAQRISVKSRTFKKGAAYIEYNMSDVFDWLAIVILPVNKEDSRRFFIIPREIADKHARRNGEKTKSANGRYWSIVQAIKLFGLFENNFSLQQQPKEKLKSV